MTVTRRADAAQRSHRWLGFPLAVVYKFVDDQGTYQAALLTYYGFVSLFPLLLLAVTVLGFALAGDPAAQQAVLNSALRGFPVIGDQIGENIHSLSGSVTALVVGVVVSLYGGLGVTQAALTASHQMWAVPIAERPGLAAAYGRGLVLLAVFVVSVLASTGLSTLSTATAGLGTVARVLAPLLAVAVNVGLFLLAFALLTVRRVRTRRLLPGAVVAAVGWQVLQLVGTYLVSHELAGTSASYGVFGIVLGLLAWIYLSAVLVLFSMEINTVRELGLAPRSLLSIAAPADPSLTEGDRRAYTAYAGTQRYKTFQEVDVSFDGDDHERLFDGLHHMQLAMPRGDEARAREFFVGVLGMSEIAKPPALADRGGAWFRAGGLELHLGVEDDFRPARKGHPGILVTDLDAVATRVATTGQDVTWDGDFPGFRRFYAHDPFGNRLEFLEALRARA